MRIVYESRRCVVVDKPSGLLSVPGKGPQKRDCAAARVRAMFPRASGPLTVHRLDMETSGLLLLALDAEAHRLLSGQFQRREVAKRYTAVLDGAPEGEEGTVTLRQRLDLDNRPMQILDDEQGKEAVTQWRLLERGEEGNGPARSRVEFEPRTGRSHQLRLAAATPTRLGGLGAPIVGDSLYGDRASADRLMLHAERLAFVDPDGDARVCLCCEAPF